MNHLELKNIRKELKITQAEMAIKLGLSTRGYQNYEQGDRTIPKSIILLLKKLTEDEQNTHNQKPKKGGNEIAAYKQIEHLEKLTEFLEAENRLIKENYEKSFEGIRIMVESLTQQNENFKELGMQILKMVDALSLKYEVNDEIKRIKKDLKNQAKNK